MTKGKKWKQPVEYHDRNHAEINRDNSIRMVVQECPPILGWRFSTVDDVLGTVDSATSNPSFNSSPWIRGAPHNEFSLLIRRMRSRNPRSILGLPPRPGISSANRP
jgi:hypothetical protein